MNIEAGAAGASWWALVCLLGALVVVFGLLVGRATSRSGPVSEALRSHDKSPTWPH